MMYQILYLPYGKIIRPGIPKQDSLSKVELKNYLDCLFYGVTSEDIFFANFEKALNLYVKAPKHLFEIVEVNDATR
jgi:hypothetical protein